eukprot:CAMPEP_0172543916 /NCGR_PEP_ID=MMETSP1067-20121228/14191_1 /TAXON_ID=265564 ORGANISM="Thalassiosira punctigera, Strain Tpunct2005C2" /NCGR_SAMPLE_ID=MMETSP1067 /ASSEMBLY_ACC=CAM_ASM_000444 /LENGTH=565 /DNA_ID=CAMNT_0013330403 /DNA_START=323 /DNA_END=2020 /DNA_ORIENTATION=+
MGDVGAPSSSPENGTNSEPTPPLRIEPTLPLQPLENNAKAPAPRPQSSRSKPAPAPVKIKPPPQAQAPPPLIPPDNTAAPPPSVNSTSTPAPQSNNLILIPAANYAPLQADAPWPIINSPSRVAPSPQNDSDQPALPANPMKHRPPPQLETNAAAPTPVHRKKAKKVKESLIDHTYRDFSSVNVSVEDDGAGDGGDKSRPNFPAKLHSIVSNPNYQHIICWLPHGRSWKIVDKYLLTSVIIPQHFAHAKFESFNRSVNGWGFKRLLNPGPDCKAYYHECFLRGRPELTRLMQRLVNPGKRLPDKAGEPDFYEISKNFPLPSGLPPLRPSLPTSAIPSNKSQERGKGPASALPSPNARFGQQDQPGPFASLPPHANGYMYGCPQFTPHPSMPSPAVATQRPGKHSQQQPQQHMYWPGQGGPGSPPFQPTPSPYGYYPYPPQAMMMGAGPGGYHNYMMQPYMHPGMHNPYFPPTPTAAATPLANGLESESTAWMKPIKMAAKFAPDSTNISGGAGRDMEPSGLATVAEAAEAAVAEVASVAGDNAEEFEGKKHNDLTGNNAELTMEV